MTPQPQDAITHPTARVLTWGFRLSAALLLIGLLLSGLQGERLHTTLEGVPEVASEIANGNGAGLVALGVLVMIATPIASTLTVAIACHRSGDTRYAKVTAVVLVILVISALLSAT